MLFLLEVCKLLAQLRKAILAELVVLLRERAFLNLELRDPAADIVQLCGHGIHLGADHGAGLVHKVDGLVGEEAVGDVAVGERRGGDKGVVVDGDMVVILVALLEAAEDGDGVLHRRLVHLHGLETALQRGVLFDVLAVLVQRGGADAVELTACQHGLQEIAGVHAALGLARADNGVQLVDEEEDLALGFFDLLQNGFQSLLKLAPVLCARDERAHVQGEDGLVLETLGHVLLDDALGKALGDGGLADARFADQDGVILGLAGEDADHVADLAVAADHGVKLVLPRAFDKVGAVFRQGVVGALGIVRGHGAGLDLAQLAGEIGLGDVVVGENALYRGRRRGKDADHQMLHGDVLIAHGLGGLLGGVDGAAGLVGGVDLGLTAHLRELGNGGVQLGQDLVAVRAQPFEDGLDRAAVLVDQGVEQMLGHDEVIAVLLCHGLRGLQSLDGILRVIVFVHGCPSLSLG